MSLTAIGKDEPLKFANPVTTNCAMAVTLAQWSREVSKAARDIYGPDSKISEIGTGSDYQCRKVNGASSGRVSEHAFANALDIMAFKFSDGSKTELESGWNGSDKEKAFWRAVHSASCKLFMTVIGRTAMLHIAPTCTSIKVAMANPALRASASRILS